MKLTNGEIFNAKEPLQKLLGEKLPVPIAFGLAKTAMKLEGPLTAINQVRQGLFKTHGDFDSKKQKYTVKPYVDDGTGKAIRNSKAEEFEKEMGELMAQETEIVIDVVKLPDTLEIEPRVLMALEKFVK